MTTKRLVLSIPVAGMALTSVGCGDPIVAEFAAVTAFDLALPYSGSYDNAGYTITLTDIDFTNMVVADDFTTSITNTGSYTVTDVNGVEVAAGDINTVFNGTVTVVEEGAKYTIAFVADDGQGGVINLDLDCDLVDDVDLNCTDANAAVWTFQAQ